MADEAAAPRGAGILRAIAQKRTTPPLGGTIEGATPVVVERAPAPYLSEELRQELCGYALKIARETFVPFHYMLSNKRVNLRPRGKIGAS